MRTQEKFIEAMINEYDIKILNAEKDVERYIRQKRIIKERHNGCPDKYNSDFDYQEALIKIDVYKALGTAYMQAKQDFKSVLDICKSEQ